MKTEEYGWNEGLKALEKKIGKEFSVNNPAVVPTLVAIAGGSCSGKTFLAHELAKILDPSLASVISLDNYYRDRRDHDFPRDEWGMLNFDCPLAYRSRVLVEAIRGLRNGEEIWVPEYSTLSNSFISPYGHKISPRLVIIVEGLFALQFLAAFENQIRVYVETDFKIVLDRRVERDTVKYKTPSAEVIKDFEARIWPNHLRHVVGQKDCAEIIINCSNKEEKNHE